MLGDYRMRPYNSACCYALLLTVGPIFTQTISFLPPANNYYTGGSRFTYFTGIAIADFDKDGKIDIAYSKANFGIPDSGVSFGNGDGSFRPDARVLELFLIGLRGPIFAADFDGDGNPDVAFSQAHILRDDGTGKFGEPIPLQSVLRYSRPPT